MIPNASNPTLETILVVDDNPPRYPRDVMSGEAAMEISCLNYGWAFIDKPFVSEKLVSMVRHAFHSRDRSQPGGREFDSRVDPEIAAGLELLAE